MKISYRVTAVLLSLCTANLCQARPLDAIGQCKAAGAMTFADGVYHGDAKAMQTVPDFGQRHAVATTDEDAWVRALDGTSGKNRLYQDGKQRVVLVTLCKPEDCEHHRAYIAYDPDTGAYGASHYIGSHVREAGPMPTDRMYPAELGTALWCAQSLDWKGK